MGSVSVEDIADKVAALWKICRSVEVHQHLCRHIHMCARDMLDRIQDMEGEPGLESVMLDLNNTLKSTLQALKPWESISPYQAIVDEVKFVDCLETQRRVLGDCNLHHVFGLEHQWKAAYLRAKGRDETDLEGKLLKLAEEPPEPDVEGVASRPPSPSPRVIPSTAMERLLAEGFKRSGINRNYPSNRSDSTTPIFELRALSQVFKDSVDRTSQCQPLLVPHELSPVVAPLVQDLTSIEEDSNPEKIPMQQVTHVPFVTLSDMNKMEDAHYLHNIRDLTLQTRLFGGHPMRQNGLMMTYLATKYEDQFSIETAKEDARPFMPDTGVALVSVRLCQAHPSDDQLLYGIMQRRLLQEACTWSRLRHKNILPFLGMCRYLKNEKTPLFALVSPWCERTLSDYVKVFQDVNHINLVTGVAQGLHYLHSHGLHHGGLHAGAVFVNEHGQPQIGSFPMCSKFEQNPPLNLIVHLLGQNALRCMAPEYIRSRVSSSGMMLNADVWSLAMVILQIFTHKTPFENVPMPYGLVAFLVQGTTPSHPTTVPAEQSGAPLRVPLKRKHTNESPMPQSNFDALETAAVAAAAVLPSGEEGHNAVNRGLSDEMWSLLQWCWKYDPRARPTMDMITQRLKDITQTTSVGLKNLTSNVRKTTIYPVATGGQCDIYLGEFVAHPHEKVAMKRLRMFSNDCEPVRKELIREVRLWNELKHPNILEFYGLYDAGGMSIFMISKWMSQGSAPDYLQRNPDANRREIVTDALRGLCYLHEMHVLHGDLKGANILIKDDGTACLADLGLARASSEATTTSLRGNGSIRYMSPEILLTEDAKGIQKTPVKTFESDVFAFGLVIRELLSDELPYADISSMAHIIRLIASGHCPSRPKSPVAQQWLCDRMWDIIQATMQSDPKSRPPAVEVEHRIKCVPSNGRHSPRRRISGPDSLEGNAQSKRDTGANT
ncbi:kinase-like protein [Ceratobasidium sp. AG-I]|nr:kinase-like protein [Ceratobasidium sp. AG-I]